MLFEKPPETQALAPRRYIFERRELIALTDYYLTYGTYPPDWQEEDFHRALAQAQKQGIAPKDFEEYLTAEGVSDALVAQAHKQDLRGPDPKARGKAAETIHRLRGRLLTEESGYERAIKDALTFAKILKGELPVPEAIDVSPALEIEE